ncbi:FHA domain-containing protein [Streptomyces sp. NPDC002054]|uniref:FHA domain-containing protein n=1 Tax=Streptomyces sp. NPDC002054 TaxID=3154663 RepID=UPI003321C21E
MQIRLTVIGPRGGHQTVPATCDVLVTAPVGTPLSAVASGLAATVGGPDTGGTVILYAGAERLDLQRRILGEPPLVDGAVLALHAPVPEAEGASLPGSTAQLHVVAGPDAGGVHLLHPGQIRIGRSGEADVPLDDPDVSRLHCAVVVGEDGRVGVADLGSTNGTTVDGSMVGPDPVRLPPGALLRLGESTLLLTPPPQVPLPLTPDSEGHLSLPNASRPGDAPGSAAAYAAPGGADAPGSGQAAAGGAAAPGHDPGHRPGGADAPAGAGHPAPGGAAAPGPGRPATGGAGAYAAPGDPGHGPGAAGAAAPSTGQSTGGAGAYAAPGGAGAYVAPRASHRPGQPAGAAGPEQHTPGVAEAPGGAASSGAGRPATGGAGAYAAPGDPGHGPGAAGAAGPAQHGPGAAGGPAGAHGTGRPGQPAPGRAAGPGTGPYASGGAGAYAAPGAPGAGQAAPGAGRRASGGAGAFAAEPHGAAPRPAGAAGPEQQAFGAAGAPGAGQAAAGGAAGPGQHAPGAAGAPGRAAGSGTGRPAAGAAGAYATPGGAGAPAGAAGRAQQAPAAAGADGNSTGGAMARKVRRGIGAWARRWVGREEFAEAAEAAVVEAEAECVPGGDNPAALLLAALGPTAQLWTRDPAMALSAGLGAGSRVSLRDSGALGLAGPRARLTGLARSVVAQLAALHSPAELEIVLLANDRARPVADRVRDWGWLGWLPHTRPAHGQDCRLLLAYDRDQATARTGELTRRLDDGPLGANWAAAEPEAVRQAAAAYDGPYTLVVLDGDPGPGPLRDLTGRLASHGPAAGIHLLCLAEAPAATPASTVAESFEAACSAAPAFRDCGAVALLSGDVATTIRSFPVSGGRLVGHGRGATADAVSAAWAERFARALAPLRPEAGAPGPAARPATAAALPQTARLLDELGLARATPASLMARWAAATDQGQAVGGLAEVILGSGRRGPVGAELVADGPHLLIEGPPGSGRTELLRSVAASLSSAARPDRLGLVLLDGAGGERGEGLAPCTELPHVSAHLVASDPLRMREFAQALGAELKRRSELLDGVPFSEWHARPPAEVAERMIAPRQPSPGEHRGNGDLDPQRTGTLRLRTTATRTEPAAGPSPLPRLVVLVDDFDALVAPALGSTGRPAAGSVVRALEAVAREGGRLGVHLVATSARPERTAGTEPARLARLRVELDAPDQPGPGRGLLWFPDGRSVPFQGGRVTGRIPRTATQRPTVVPVEWERMGDPPARRPVRELGNGPTDLALLASALDRASHLVSAIPVLFPPAP